MVIENWTWVLASLVAGAGLSILFFWLLSLNGRLYAGGRVLAATALHVGRLAVAALVFIAVARLGGAVPLLALLAGFLVARPLLVRRFGRA